MKDNETLDYGCEGLVAERLTCNVSPSIFQHNFPVSSKRKKPKLQDLHGLYLQHKRLSSQQINTRTDEDYDNLMWYDTITQNATDNSAKHSSENDDLVNAKIDADQGDILQSKPIKKKKTVKVDNLDSPVSNNSLTPNTKKKKTSFMNDLDLVHNEIKLKKKQKKIKSSTGETEKGQELDGEKTSEGQENYEEGSVGSSAPSDPSVKHKHKKKHKVEKKSRGSNTGGDSDCSDVVISRNNKKVPRMNFSDDESDNGVETPTCDSETSTDILDSEARLFWKTPTTTAPNSRFKDVGASNQRSENTTPESFQCEFCPKTFANSRTLRLHSITIHCEERPFRCNFCEKSFVFQKSLHDHVAMHFVKRQRDGEFFTPTDLKGHTTVNRSTQTDVEDLPPKQTRQSPTPKWTERDTGKRQPTELDSSEIESPQVDTSQVDSSQVDSSQVDCSQADSTLNSTQRTYECPMCDKIYPHRSSLKNHLAIHEEKKFECEVCHKKFVLKHQLKQHSVTHQSRSYTCDVCDKEFLTEKSCMLHQEAHSSQSFKCDQCDKVFFHASHLQSHLRDHDKFKCNTCGLVFPSKKALSGHKIKHAEKKFHCDQCDKSFCFNSYLEKHKVVHTPKKTPKFTCEICGSEYVAKQSLQTHMTTHGERNIKCDHCDARFYHQVQLRCHLLVHSEERPFVCKPCGWAFKRAKDLKMHHQNHCKVLKGTPAPKCKTRLDRKLDVEQSLSEVDTTDRVPDSDCEIIFDDRKDPGNDGGNTGNDDGKTTVNDDEMTVNNDEMTVNDDGERTRNDDVEMTDNGSPCLDGESNKTKKESNKRKGESNKRKEESINKIKGESNKMKGESSKIKGESSKIKGESNMIKGESNKIKGESNKKKDKKMVQCYKCTNCRRIYREGDALMCHLCVLQKRNTPLFFPFSTRLSSSIPADRICTPYKDNFESQQKMLRKT